MAKRTARKTKKRDVLVRSAELIGWAIGGLEREIVATRQKLDALTRQASQLRSRMSGKSGLRAAVAGFAAPAAVSTGGSDRPRKRRQMSAAARKRISDMQKKRWAEWRKKKAAAQK